MVPGDLDSGEATKVPIELFRSISRVLNVAICQHEEECPLKEMVELLSGEVARLRADLVEHENRALKAWGQAGALSGKKGANG